MVVNRAVDLTASFRLPLGFVASSEDESYRNSKLQEASLDCFAAKEGEQSLPGRMSPQDNRINDLSDDSLEVFLGLAWKHRAKEAIDAEHNS